MSETQVSETRVSEARVSEETPAGDRRCLTCRAPIVRHTYKSGNIEPAKCFRERLYCSRVCRSRDHDGREKPQTVSEREERIRLRSLGKLVEKAEQIRWDPIVYDLPSSDRCWAGFVVGRQCVLRRGDHATHRDAQGREFVRVERQPAVKVERNTGVDTLETNFRREWRSKIRG